MLVNPSGLTCGRRTVWVCVGAAPNEDALEIWSLMGNPVEVERFGSSAVIAALWFYIYLHVYNHHSTLVDPCKVTLGFGSRKAYSREDGKVQGTKLYSCRISK